jgi:beta-phosphoglucomutase-like phosphatase (HAD superfamily)
MTGLGASRADCVIIGDSITDIQADVSAGIHSIGYANKPGKRPSFTAEPPAPSSTVWPTWPCRSGPAVSGPAR